jgi:hypothetical protein
MRQITNTILMIRPVAFRMNEQTAVNNYYQQEIEDVSDNGIQARALKEFNNFVDKLRGHGVHVIVVDDNLDQDTPDSIFPNNWISFHESGTVGIYPMFAENRRRERREDILERIEAEGFEIKNVMDYTSAEAEGLFLEATGSIVLDREKRLAYCALSARADEDLFIEFCEDFEYTPVVFHAYQDVEGERELIYHTNVMMAITEKNVVICLDCIDDAKERKHVIDQIKRSGKNLVEISEEQVENFAGNMLQVLSGSGQPITVMSKAAYDCLSEEQRAVLGAEAELLYSDLSTIETCGGGSARCMMAEVFL